LPLVGPIIFLFALFIFIGMLELAKMFSDPFGDDEVDFPIHMWLDKFIENQLAFLEYDYAPAAQGFQSELLTQEKLAWIPGQIASIVHRDVEGSALGGGFHGTDDYHQVRAALQNPPAGMKPMAPHMAAQKGHYSLVPSDEAATDLLGQPRGAGQVAYGGQPGYR